ncbi:uncharacterized protein LOC122820354 [Gambusia affinis]|uniref:uncharacterized protein LOC122820354 n=1 Tax=Gambusia affinis TaxID=33528 RepID=UPI001CDC3076|nr:uncharacterized protein LOC122820354 [Gambusia affinis]
MTSETVTIEALEAVVDRLFINMTPEEWMGLAAGNPAASTTCTLGEIYGDILELFSSNVLENLHKQTFTIESLEAAVGNKVPETFAGIMDVDGDYRTEHTENLNWLIVKYLLDRIYHSLDSDDPPSDHVDQASCKSMIIRHMVKETDLIIKDLMGRLCASNEESKKVAGDNPVQPKEPSDAEKEMQKKPAEPKLELKDVIILTCFCLMAASSSVIHHRPLTSAD